MIVGPMAMARFGFWIALTDFFQRLGDQGLAAVGAIIGNDNQFIADGFEFIFENQQFFIAWHR